VLVVALLVAVLVAASLGAAYFTGAGNRQTVTTTSIRNTTSTATVTLVSTEMETSTTNAFVQVQMGAVMITNASVPASAWSLSNPTVSFLQCGQAQTNGSGWITLANTGNEPTNVTGIIFWVSNSNSVNTSNTYTEYVAEGPASAHGCTISPSSSLTIYFSFHGPTPIDCQGYNAYVELSEMSYGYLTGVLGATSECVP